MAVDVWLLKLTELLYPELDAVASQLNEADQRKAAAFHFKEDKYRFLGGRYLLMHWLIYNGFDKNTIRSVNLDEYKRPVIDGVSFSISHTHGWVVLAASIGNTAIGIDIEELKQLDLPDYLSVFTPAEQDHILERDNIIHFFNLWTRKESFLKALGTGFLLEPSTVEVLDDTISHNGRSLQIYPLDIEPGLAAHLTLAPGSHDIKTTVIETIPYPASSQP